MDARRRGSIRLEPTADDKAPAIRGYRLRFTGSGGEYFRVWIVNVLLSLITLGFYTPFARKRTVHYFYSHSLIADSALEFTAQQRRMVVGFLLVFLLSAAYQLAVRTEQDTTVSIFIIAGALLAPVIWASAMRFRLTNTRWRGLRLIFTATWKEIYRASWPVFALALVWLATFFAVTGLVPDLDSSAQTTRMRLPRIPGSAIAVVLLALFLSVLCIIRIEYNYRSLLVLRTRIGDQVSRWKPVYMDFVNIWVATVIVFLLSALAVTLLTGALIAATVLYFKANLAKPEGVFFMILMTVVMGLLSLLFLLLASTPARAFREARMFRLIWNNTGISHIARFKCTLSTRKFVFLRIKNLVLSLLTLGLYRPFARVNEYQMKYDSVTLYVKGSLDQLTGQLEAAQKEGFGDALADAAGLDLIG